MPKKVLFLTYYFPPSGGSGVQRPLKFIKYLSSFGWEPVVYTVENGEFPEYDESLLKEIPSNIKIIKRPIFEPFALYKAFIGQKKDYKLVAGYMHQKKATKWTEKIALWIRSNLFIPDARMLWIRPSVFFLSRYIAKNKIDAIITSGPPHSLHVIGLSLKKITNKPWIADFRDPWTQIDYWEDLNLTKWADKTHRDLEKQVLKYADKVVCVSPTWGEGLAQIGNRTIDYISNGFDEADMHNDLAFELDNEFSIVHIGMMGKSRNHEVFWDAIKELITENDAFKKDVKVKLYGKLDGSVNESVARTELEKYTEIHAYIPHNEIIKIQKSAQVLYLSVNDTANALGILTGKIYEYLAAKRPILCIGPTDGEAAKVIAEAGAGLVSNFGDKETLKTNILSLYQNYKQKIAFEGGTGIEKFTRKSQTEQLAKLLDQIS